ncbi:MAG: DUF2530 domain-containing protein [Pseudonocardiaceae bacterium]
MAGAQRDGEVDPGRPVPPLPRALAGTHPLVAAVTLAWFAGSAVLALLGAGGVWVSTCVTGGLLGLLGFGIMHWQRSAARRSARGGQRGLH